MAGGPVRVLWSLLWDGHQGGFWGGGGKTLGLGSIEHHDAPHSRWITLDSSGSLAWVARGKGRVFIVTTRSCIDSLLSHV